jgi:hypothetical protein
MSLRDTPNHENKKELSPSPPWGRGWTATGDFTSRRGPGEGVKKTCQENKILGPRNADFALFEVYPDGSLARENP